MIEQVNIGETVKIRVPLWDGQQLLTDKTVNVSIERVSDGKFFDGDWDPGTYATVEMTELTGNAHREGVYEYVFVPDAAGTYDWSVKYTEGAFTTYFKGRIIAGISVDGMTAAIANKIADHAWRRAFANIRASGDGDAVSVRSGLGMMAKLINRFGPPVGGVFEILAEDDATVLGRQRITTLADAEPIVGLDTE